jgi:hypothetical protein
MPRSRHRRTQVDSNRTQFFLGRASRSTGCEDAILAQVEDRSTDPEASTPTRSRPCRHRSTGRNVMSPWTSGALRQGRQALGRPPLVEGAPATTRMMGSATAA